MNQLYSWVWKRCNGIPPKLSFVFDPESCLQFSPVLTCYIIFQDNMKIGREAITPKQNEL
jgi:hypothetical protein